MRLRPLLFLLILFLARPLEARIYLDVYAIGFRRVVVAAPPFRGPQERLGTDFAELLNKDLELTGFFVTTPFSLMDRRMLEEPEEKEHIRFEDWSSLGIELLSKARFREEGQDVIVEAFLYDVTEGSLIFAKRYRTKKDLWRSIVHRLSDDIVLAVTGERGITNLKILFVAEEGSSKEVYLSDIDGYMIKKLTSFGSITLSPCLSPDGSLLAYTSYKKGRPGLYVMDLRKRSDVYEDTTEGIKVPHLFLSNRTLVYSGAVGRSSGIFTLDLERRITTRLVGGDGIYTSASFTRDGKKMVFVSDMHGSPQVFLKNLENGEIRRITFSGSYNTSPAISPKGGLIAFVSKLEGHLEICLTDEDGKYMKVLTDGGMNDSPQFSPCGRYVIYSGRKAGASKIHLSLANGEMRRVLKLTGRGESQPRFFIGKED
jgi:TolB protein